MTELYNSAAGTAAEILHREWCWRIHVQRGAEAGRNRDVHQVRLQQRGRDSGARLSVQDDAQYVVEVTREDRTGPGEEATRPCIQRRADAVRRLVLPGARKGPLEDEAGHGVRSRMRRL